MPGWRNSSKASLIGDEMDGKQNLKKLFKLEDKNEKQLLEQFYNTLEATYLKAKKVKDDFGEFADVAARVDALFQLEKSWRNAYYIEQLLVPLYDDISLDVEFNRRLVEAKQKMDEDTQNFYQQFSQTTEKSEKQALLNRMVNDLQWRYELNQLQRKLLRLTRIRTGFMFILSVLVFYIPTLLIDFRNGEVEYLTTAIKSGWLGAAFSMLLGLKSRMKQSTLDDLKVQYRYSFMFSRVIIGIGGALIFYYFLQADILGGSVFPALENMATHLDNKNYALLVVWCFLAGFSEKFVPNLLSKTEEQATVK